MPFEIEFSPVALDHLRALRKRDQQIVIDAIAEQLTHQPDHATARRKPLAENALAPWELRVGDFRAFYEIDADTGKVLILAIGEKSHDRLFIGGEEIEL